MEHKLYYYKAEVLKIIDGDTIKARIDLGFNLAFTDNIRIARINAPEIKGPEKPRGKAAVKWLKTKIKKGSTVYLKTVEWKGKYGRCISEVIIFEDGNKVNISDAMVEAGHAEYVTY